jgi:hypothetical protein
MFASESQAGEGLEATDSQELMPETKMLGLQEEGAYKRKHLAHKMKYCMHLIYTKHVNQMNVTRVSVLHSHFIKALIYLLIHCLFNNAVHSAD